MYGQRSAREVADAGMAVVVTLLETLVDRKLVSNSDVRRLLTNAAGTLGPHDYSAPVGGAVGIILNDLLPNFPEDGGD